LDSISSPAGLDTEAVAYLARSEIASSLRSRQPIQLCLLVGGMVRNPFLMPRLYWLDQYGSIQNLKYGAHGFGSNFALSVLDQRFRSNLSRKEAMELIRECFEQLRQRYVINSPQPPRIKCIDAFGVKELLNE
ncbi:predicted protein, partial [Thalassiosira pseudonana CCMP1335]